MPATTGGLSVIWGGGAAGPGWSPTGGFGGAPPRRGHPRHYRRAFGDLGGGCGGPGWLPTGDLRAARSVEPADFHRLRSGDENLASYLGATRRGELAGFGVDFSCNDSFRRLDFADVAVLAVLVRALHEVGPDGQRATRTLQLEVAVVVEPHPHHADKLRRESGEPTVA